MALKTCSDLISNDSVQFEIEIRIISLPHSHSSEYAEFGHFSFLHYFAEDGKEMYVWVIDQV